MCVYILFLIILFLFFCYPIVTLKNWWKEFGSAPAFIQTPDNCDNKEQTKKDICVPLKKKQKKKKRKETKESKMKINTELVGQKVVPLFFWLFARFTIYLGARYFVYRYIVSQIKSGSTMFCFIHFFYVGLIRLAVLCYKSHQGLLKTQSCMLGHQRGTRTWLAIRYVATTWNIT